MKSLFIVFALFYIFPVNGSRVFFHGHLVGQDILAPIGPDVRADDTISTHNFTQKLDHYDHTNTNVWNQRYYVNTEYFNSTANNVVFLMIGGEAEASIRWMSSGAWIASAEKYGALLFYVEHRFYGVSHPFSDTSTENLRYLSSQQALADLAHFITAMNEEYTLANDVKWIAFGGSYPGSLAAWLRQKFPHLVQGAMSASGPLYAQLDFPEYLQVVADDLRTHSQQCVDVVRTGYSQMEELLQNSEEENITSIFNLCDNVLDDPENFSDIALLFEVIADNFAYVAQYNKIPSMSISIDDVCEILVDETIGKEVYRLARVNTLISGSDCVDYKYENFLTWLRDTTISNSGMMRQWIYQTCAEYGWYQTSSQENPVFSSRFPLSFFTGLCVDLFGIEFNETYISERTSRINTYYGGYDIEVSNVVFVHGSFDPWAPMGLVETRSSDAPVIFINGTAHCANMYIISDSDIPELVAAKEEVDRLIGVWLSDTSSANKNIPMSLMFTILVFTSRLLNVF